LTMANVLSFHPIFQGDHNRLCAGRDPDNEDLAAIKRAEAVILPQGCRASLYQAAIRYGNRIFPNYDARFAYPGKIGQSRLFEKAGVPHPVSLRYADTVDFIRRHPEGDSPFGLPAVIKLDWGGEGDGVFPVSHDRDLADVLKRLQAIETTGQRGFIVQQWIPTGGRALRVVVTGHLLEAYWRIAPTDEAGTVSLARGGHIDRSSDRHLIRAAESAVAAFCRQTAVNLAGFDILFSTDPSVADKDTPLFLEINYFFGRRGLGGSEAYYRRLIRAIGHWLRNGDTQAIKPERQIK